MRLAVWREMSSDAQREDASDKRRRLESVGRNAGQVSGCLGVDVAECQSCGQKVDAGLIRGYITIPYIQTIGRYSTVST